MNAKHFSGWLNQLMKSVRGKSRKEKPRRGTTNASGWKTSRLLFKMLEQDILINDLSFKAGHGLQPKKRRRDQR